MTDHLMHNEFSSGGSCCLITKMHVVYREIAPWGMLIKSLACFGTSLYSIAFVRILDLCPGCFCLCFRECKIDNANFMETQ